MVRVDLLIFGYRRLRLVDDTVGAAMSLLLKCGLCARVGADRTLVLGLGDAERFLASGGDKLCSEVSGVLGLRGVLDRYRHCYGCMLALLIVGFLYFFSGNIVWDVRVSGNERLSDYEVISALDAQGFGVGSLWWEVDTSDVEARLLSSAEEVGWVSINRHGTVAYVEIAERVGEGDDSVSESSEYCNIVADRACVIVGITVSRGVPAVKVGDVVEAGDVLISGIIQNESGTELCRAEGEVLGVLSGEVTANVQRYEQVPSYSDERLAELTVNFFGNSLNIFKNYGNYEGECDIIESREGCVLFDTYRLPFGISKVYSREKTYVSVSYTDDELVSRAAHNMKRSLYSYLTGCDLIKMKTYGEYTEDGYTMTCELVYVASVGKESVIDT